MLDVDCKDRTLGLSCPPPNFVELSFIDSIKLCLAPGGILSFFISSFSFSSSSSFYRIFDGYSITIRIQLFSSFFFFFPFRNSSVIFRILGFDGCKSEWWIIGHLIPIYTILVLVHVTMLILFDVWGALS